MAGKIIADLPTYTHFSKYAGTICHSKLRKNLVTPRSTRITQATAKDEEFDQLECFLGYAFK